MTKEVKRLQVAIDGPAGAGKSTIARALAGRLNMQFLDTGAMYRAITLKIYRRKIDLEDSASIKALLETTTITLNDEQSVFLDGADVTKQIRQAHVNALVSPVSKLTAVRRQLVELQQQIAKTVPRLVMEGRDTTSIVLPEADYKFYLDATLEERARRRYEEELAKGFTVKLDEVKNQIASRDLIDSKRADSPLRLVDDAILIDTTKLDIEAVVEKIVEHIDEELR